MSLTKIYKYQIKLGSEVIYEKMQQQVALLYRQHAEVEFLYLKDSINPLIKTEVIRFFDQNSAEVIKKIDNDPNFLKLFDEFMASIYDPTSGPIKEEILNAENWSASSKPHHIEIYCSDLKKSIEFWSWFLEVLGYKEYQKWPAGISFKLGDTYFVFVQAEDKYLPHSFHRCRPGLNHLAFHAINREQVDKLTSELKSREIKILYEDRHPHAGGNGTYAIYFEDPERIKIEVIAP